jgi:LuxR family maltose regulon positive regulatory protein
LDSINFIIKHIPHNFRLVISSRNTPELDLAYLRAKGLATELGLEDLRFTSEEVAQFCEKVMGLTLSPDIIQSLLKRTDGWVTALQMAAVSIQNHKDPSEFFSSLKGDSQFLVDYLAEEVLDQQPDEIRQFLLRSSVLDSLNSSLAEAVVNPDAQPGYGSVILNRLEHAHLFITALDEKREWFRYHQLFLDFLRHIQAEINPEEIPVLQKRAAIWFEQNGNLDEAFRYAFKTDDITWAADLLERNIQTMIETGNIMPLTHWSGKIPQEIIQERPTLMLGLAWGAIASYELDMAEHLISNIQRACDDSKHKPFSKEDKAILGGLAICQSTLALFNNTIEKAAEYSDLARDYLQEESPLMRSMVALDHSLYHLFSGDTEKAIIALKDTIRIARQSNNLMILVIGTIQLAETQAMQGNLDQAWATLQKARFLAGIPEEQDHPLASLVDISAGAILLERDHLEEAKACLERGYHDAQQLWTISSLDSLVARAHLKQIQGDIQGTKAIIEEAAQMALSTESSQWDDTLVSATAVRLALLRGDLADAAQWWIRGGFPKIDAEISLSKYPYQVFEYLKLVQARFLLQRGQDCSSEDDLKLAIKNLDFLIPEVKKFKRRTSEIEILILKALALNCLEAPSAKDVLLGALALGEPSGYRRIFLNEGPRIHDLLAACLAHRQQADAVPSYLPSPDFINSLMRAIRQQSPAPSVTLPSQQAAERIVSTRTIEIPEATLSQREIEVLTLIAQGKSNKEISAELYLAVNTVKRHAYNIYNKLGVNRRTQAVSLARQLGLIP